MPSSTGTVKFFNTDRGFGFIKPEAGGQDVFVHINDLRGSTPPLDRLHEDQRVSFEVVAGREGRPRARSVKVIK